MIAPGGWTIPEKYQAFLAMPEQARRDALAIYWIERDMHGSMAAKDWFIKNTPPDYHQAFVKDLYNIYERELIPYMKKNKWFGKRESDWIVRDGRLELVVKE